MIRLEGVTVLYRERAALHDIDLQIESAGSPDKKKFMDIARKDGLRAAIAWRDARFAGKSK